MKTKLDTSGGSCEFVPMHNFFMHVLIPKCNNHLLIWFFQLNMAMSSTWWTHSSLISKLWRALLSLCMELKSTFNVLNSLYWNVSLITLAIFWGCVHRCPNPYLSTLCVVPRYRNQLNYIKYSYFVQNASWQWHLATSFQESLLGRFLEKNI
jgi:hypothetical protein